MSNDDIKTKNVSVPIWAFYVIPMVALVIALIVAFTKINDLTAEVEDLKGKPTIGSALESEAPGLTQIAPSTAELGGTRSITTNDGITLTYNIPEDQRDITQNYLQTVALVYSIDQVVAPNIIITGDGESVTDSTSSINASTFSNTRSIYGQIFGEEFTSQPDEAVYSPAYEYLINGKLPEGSDASYKCKELDSIIKDGITYRVVTVDYDTDYTEYTDADGNEIENPEKNIVHTHNVSAYSDTQDVVEIIAYTADNDVDIEVAMIKKFIGAE